MMLEIFVLAQQRLSFIEETRAGLWELWLFFMRTIRDGRVAWVLVIVAGIIVYQRFFRK